MLKACIKFKYFKFITNQYLFSGEEKFNLKFELKNKTKKAKIRILQQDG